MSSPFGGLRGLHHPRCKSRSRLARCTLSWTSTLLQRHSGKPPREPAGPQLPPLEFRAPTAYVSPEHRSSRQAFQGLTHLAPSGFPNLLAPSSAPSLPALSGRSALGVRPPELCSSRAAVRRLRRRSPHAVRSACPALGPSPTICRRSLGSAPALDDARQGRRSIPRLQGLAPHESPISSPVV